MLIVLARGKGRIRLEAEDPYGNKRSIVLEGSIDSEEAIQELLKLLKFINAREESIFNNQGSVGEKIWNVIEEYFPFGAFTSSKLLEVYEDTYNEPIKLSIVSTYLSRFARKGLLDRVRGKNEWVYRKVIKERH